LLRAVHPIPESEIERALRRLTDAELLYGRGILPEANYHFKHALIRDTAYEGLLKSQRRYLHERIVQIVEERFPEIATAKPELLAHHCTEARKVEQAVRYWHKAGRKAIERSANTEAILQFRKALELVEALPPSSETVMEEVRLRMALTTPLIATKGYTASEVEQECNRALSLCRQIGNTPYLHGVLGGLSSIYLNRSELDICLELAKRMLRLAETLPDPASLWAHYVLGFTLASQGNLRLAHEHLQQCIALYDVSKGGTYGYVQDPGPTAMAMLSEVVYLLGYPDQAMKRMQEALSVARSLSHPYTLAWVLGHTGRLYWERGEKLAALECWKELASISSEQGFKPLLNSASFSLGYALAEQEGGSGRIEKMREFYNRYTSIDSHPFPDKARWLGLLAVAEGKAGQTDEALAIIDEALSLAEKTKKPQDVCELSVFKGQLLLMKNPDAVRKAKQCFRAAIRIARAMHAKADELTAAIQMARMLSRRGRRHEARTMLAEIYNWFTEGFDTANLKDAKALLDELSA
jgi:tetratricopeptide (TPR) repeat protein